MATPGIKALASDTGGTVLATWRDGWGRASPPDPMPNQATDLIVANFAQLAEAMAT